MPAFSWLALFFGAFYFVYGAYLPFWSLWLEGIGVSAEQIGLLLGAGMAIRFRRHLLIMGRIKGAGHLLPITRLLCLLSLLAFLGFYVSHSLWWLVAADPGGELHLPDPDARWERRVPTRMVVQTHFDYGKVRLCGSFAFIVASTLVGALVGNFGSEWVLHTMVAGLLLMLLLSVLPLNPAPQELQGERARASLRDTLKSASVRRFLLITALLQGSHAAYYGFSAIYWKAEGYSGTVIGYLWALGVVAEISHVAADKRFLQRLNAQTLFLVGAGCVVRWSLLGASSELWVLVLGQLLHAVTFCVSHLGAIRFMTRQLPAEQMIPTQGLYAALGLGMMVAALMTICGVLFEPVGGGIFFLMILVVLPVFVLRLRVPAEGTPA
uniref:Major facilitator superfamily permease BdhT n=1 Tax=Aeromonas hydrophila TaxID=644 RepID=Q93N30_AERHY|nr:major facilitator superfamily permease BdhT [Aeromonas hydrophila]